MSKPPRRLAHLQLATPCDKRWEDLTGSGEQVRFCSGCEKRVFNLSAMTAAEGEALLARKRAGVCVSYEAGADGKPLSADQRRPHLPQQPSGVALAAAALLALSAACGPSEETSEEKSARIEVELAESRVQEQERREQALHEQVRNEPDQCTKERRPARNYATGGSFGYTAPLDPACRPAGKKYAKGAKIRIVVNGEKSVMMPARALPVCPPRAVCDPNDPLCGL
jgi:hypothetical protein